MHVNRFILNRTLVFIHNRPNIFSFVEVLTQFQTNAYVKGCLKLNIKCRRKRKSVFKQDFVHTELQAFSERRNSRFDFVERVDYKNKVK